MLTNTKFTKLKVTLRKTDDDSYVRDLYFDIKDNSIAQKWANALYIDYLTSETQHAIEKQFMLHGWVYPNTSNARTIPFMCEELNFHIATVNKYAENNGIDYFIDMYFDPNTLTQDQLNDIHHHFEILIGQIWDVSDYYSKFDEAHQWSINNFNWLCHELESQLRGAKAAAANRSSGSIVVCMDPIVRHEMSLEEGDWDYFEMKDLEFGQVRMHYAQTGKTHREAFHDNDDTIYDSNISGIRYISGEFDVHLNIKPYEGKADTDWEAFRSWLVEKGADLSDKSLALGWCVLADFDRSNWRDKTDFEIMHELWECDDLLAIQLTDEDGNSTTKQWPYTWQDSYFQKKQNLTEISDV